VRSAAMQANTMFLLLSVMAVSSHGLRTHSSSNHQGTGAATAWAAKFRLSGQAHTAWLASVQSESGDSQFWFSEWRDLEVMLLQLQAGADQALATAPAGTKAADGVQRATVKAAARLSVLQVGPGTTGAWRRMEAGRKKGKAVATSKAAFNSTVSKKEGKGKLAGLNVNINPKSAADLMPALAMLKPLYEEGKQRIARLNAKETQSKQHFQGQQKEHLVRLATVEAKFKSHYLSQEIHTNLTRDENWMFNYWAKVRERQHRLFHTSLKIQHGTMEKEKMMIDAYEKTIAGTSNKGLVQKELAKVSGEPEVALLQAAWQTAAQYFSDALCDVRAAEDELHNEPLLV